MSIALDRGQTGLLVLDSTVAGLLLAAFREAERQGRLFLLYTPASTAAAVRRRFQLTRLDSLLPLAASWAAVQEIVQGQTETASP